MRSALTHYECSQSGEHYPTGVPQSLSREGFPLLARYDFDSLRKHWSRRSLGSAKLSMWRYAPVLPIQNEDAVVTLAEGMTPLLPAHRLGAELGLRSLWIKDESLNPTASFKARGLSCAVSLAKELGLRHLAIPSAGNAGGALACYAAAAGLQAHIFLPRDVPRANYLECCATGAEVTLVDGLISDCARLVAERSPAAGWFDVSTLKEPGRLEGKKTMGYEVAEQMQWSLPDAILYPAGGGVGLIGMWKAFEELEQLGWVEPGHRPKMIAVQAAGCQPIVRAFEQGAARSEFYAGAWTAASGLRVPKPLGDFLMLRAIRESNGTAIAVEDREMLDGGESLARLEGIFAAPEGGACIAALPKLLASGVIHSSDRVVVFNTGSGHKYLEAWSVRYLRQAAGEADKLGGLITPR